ncbi:MAG TPA: alcohol dehydrogenase catalytic domain-containing protein [Thermodesulfobacteriota bacterium]|nr:alcohol dehydrogenase catalytic domain-containing protein [Thermodesulfobacteriota bacterium]
MLAEILISPGHMELREVEMPKAGPGEIVLKVEAALTCGTDLKAFRRGHPKMPMPSLFGHEFSGTLVEVGPGVERFKVGDQVMSVHSAPCNTCFYCKKGQQNLCETVMDTKVLGAYAEYIKLPRHIVDQNAFIKPPNISFAEAAFLEPLSCVIYGLEQFHIKNDDTVAVIGAGPIGLLQVAALKAYGVKKVILAGRRKIRLDMGSDLGADDVIDVDRNDTLKSILAETAGRGADLVVECTGQPDVWESTLFMVRKGGNVLLFGGCPGGTHVSFDTGRLHYDEITLKGVFHFTPGAVRKAYEMLSSGKLNVKSLITAELPLKELPRAFELLMEGEGIKYALIP